MDVPINFCNGEGYSFRNEGGVSGVLCKNLFLADLLESQYLLEILKISLTVKNSENEVKSGSSKRLSHRGAQFFFNEEVK